jgi:hypothetical protein
VRGALATCGQCKNCLNPHWKARCLSPLYAATQQPAGSRGKLANGSKSARVGKAGRGSGGGGRGGRGGGRGRRGGRPPTDSELETNALTDGEAGQPHLYWAGSPGAEDEDAFGQETALQQRRGQQAQGSWAGTGDNSLMPTASGRQRFSGDHSLLLFTSNFELVSSGAASGWAGG